MIMMAIFLTCPAPRTPAVLHFGRNMMLYLLASCLNMMRYPSPPELASLQTLRWLAWGSGACLKGARWAALIPRRWGRGQSTCFWDEPLLTDFFVQISGSFSRFHWTRWSLWFQPHCRQEFLLELSQMDRGCSKHVFLGIPSGGNAQWPPVLHLYTRSCVTPATLVMADLPQGFDANYSHYNRARVACL